MTRHGQDLKTADHRSFTLLLLNMIFDSGTTPAHIFVILELKL